jgi:hypothetical protein
MGATHTPGESRPAAHQLHDAPTSVEVGQQFADLHGAGVRACGPTQVTEAGFGGQVI